jgi:toxin ParE1/3/4
VTSKRVVPRSQADRDLKDAIDYYIDAGANDAALGLIDAVEAAYAGISRHPGSGSPRYGQALNMPGLRAWPLSRYPYLVFYVERADHIDVWRVLHGHRDIPSWMQEPTAQ